MQVSIARENTRLIVRFIVRVFDVARIEINEHVHPFRLKILRFFWQLQGPEQVI